MQNLKARRFRESRARFGATLTLGCLVVTALAILVIVAGQWWFDYKNLADHPTIVSLPDTHTIAEELEMSKREMETYSVQADTLEKLITFLVGLSSLYAVVLGVSSYLTAQHFIERSKENAERVQELREELESRLPMFNGFGRSLEQVVSRLTRLLPNADVREKYYEGLTGDEKQQILYYENSVAFFEYLDFSYSAEKVAEIYRGLSKFYSGYFGAGFRRLKERRPKISSWDLADWEERLSAIAERARFYGRRAVEANPKSFAAKNDLAFAIQDVADLEPDLHRQEHLMSEAESLYRDSLRLEADQQCANYNLARLMYVKKNFTEAERLLTQALQKNKWQIDANPDRRLDILYNRACYRSKSAEALERTLTVETKSTKAQAALSDLKAACVSIPEVRRKSIRGDLKPNGDLDWLARTLPDDVYSIEAIREIMSGVDPA